MTSAPRLRAAFSLVEVIIAVGIVTFALVAMLGLMGSMLGNARETAAQNEALQFVPSLNDFLQEKGFSNVYGWVDSPTNQPLILAFATNSSVSNRLAMVVTNVATAADAPSSIKDRNGRLFRAMLSFSTNNPAGRTNLPSSMAGYTNFALPVRVNLVSTPAVSDKLTVTNIVFSYETAVFR